jgi:lysophospholipase L1-like esterase
MNSTPGVKHVTGRSWYWLNRMGSRKLRICLIVAMVATMLILEAVGRVYGLHQPVIYEKTTYGYRVAPNQNIHRFGNRIFYNEQGLRSEPMTLVGSPGTLRVLCLGDSVTNGGAITDQAETFPYQLQSVLRKQFGSVEVLNASAPGWAISNELGWVRENGVFGSGIVILAISTHDLFQTMAPSDIVGSHPSFPAQRPLLAIQDVFIHYVLPRVFPGNNVADPGVTDTEVSDAQAAKNRDEIFAIEEIVRKQGGKLVVLFLEQAGDKEIDSHTMSAKRQLFFTLNIKSIPVITLGSEIEQVGRNEIFRDEVHPNPAGNRTIAVVIARYLSGSVLFHSLRPAPSMAKQR